MHGLDLINTSVLGALGCDMSVFLRYFPAAETMYEVFVALAIGLILLIWIWNLVKNFGLGLGTEAEDPVKLSIRSVLFILLAYYANEIVDLVLGIGGTPYDWIMNSALPSLDFASFNSVMLTIIGVCASGAVTIIVLILVLILAWNYLKLLFEAAERCAPQERAACVREGGCMLREAARAPAEDLAFGRTSAHELRLSARELEARWAADDSQQPDRGEETR